jgi:hypothetical protein
MDEVNYDKLLLTLGEFGKFQEKALAWLLIPAYVGGIVLLTTNFAAADPEFDGFYCTDTSICDNPGGDISSREGHTNDFFSTYFFDRMPHTQVSTRFLPPSSNPFCRGPVSRSRRRSRTATLGRRTADGRRTTM